MEKAYLKSALNVGLICPGGNRATFSSLSLHYIKKELSAEPGVFTDFILENRDVFKGQESGYEIEKFDILAVTASWAGDYFKLSKIIPFLKKKRKNLKVLCGGAGVLTVPYSFLEICDAIFVGDGDGIFPEIFKDFLSEKTDMPWLLFKGERKLSPIRFAPIGVGRSVKFCRISSFGESGLVEISRGCPFSCKFCWLGSLRNKFEPRETNSIVSDINSLPKGKIGLVSAALLSHPDIKSILEACPEVSLPSCRADLLSAEIISLFAKKNAHTLTLAPETFSEELSFEIGKPFRRKKYFEIFKQAKAEGFSKIKLYFLTGLPTSREEDAKETAQTIRELWDYSKIKIEASFGQFIPMPFSPYSGKNIADNQVHLMEREILEKELKGSKISFFFSQEKKTRKIYNLVKNNTISFGGSLNSPFNGR
ncbi:radical SAM protein [candidate division WOR-3 bacterium]|nr:radical SAM protein [candidate division WOR-3 bacterium]